MLRPCAVAALLLASALAQSSQSTAYLHALAQRQTYGKLYIRGYHKGIEYYRASFGGLIPCGSRDIVYAGLGCDPGAYGEAVIGRFAAVQRGTCPFVSKALAAQRAGAAGLLVINNDFGLLRPPMGNTTDAGEVVIPVVLVHTSFAALVGDADARRPLDGGPNLHGALGPAREACVDPQLADEEWFAAMTNASLVRSAHPLARVAPGGMPLGASTVPPEFLDTRMPGTWPAAPTGASALRFGPPAAEHAHYLHPEAEAHAPHASAGPLEVALALFGTPVLGEPRPLDFAEPHDGCGALTKPIINGSVVVVVRGACSMIDKARTLQAAGARGVIVVNAATDGSTAEPVGVAQAIADAEEESRPVTIPVGMVSAQDAAGWRWTGADGYGADLTGWSVVWTATRASGAAWDELLELSKKGGATWAADAYHRRQQLRTLVMVHHPGSGTGDARRWAFLVDMAARGGVGAELDRAVEAVVWEDGVGRVQDEDGLGWTPGQGSPAPGLTEVGPVALYLLAGLRGSVLERVQEGALRCRSHGGATFNVPIPGPVDAASPYPLTRRIQDLLAVQACMEKTAVLNAAALGGYVELLRKETEARDWPALLRSLFAAPYGMSDSEAIVAATTFVDLGRAVRSVLDGPDEAVEGHTLHELLGSGVLPPQEDTTNATAVIAADGEAGRE